MVRYLAKDILYTVAIDVGRRACSIYCFKVIRAIVNVFTPVADCTRLGQPLIQE